MKSKGYVSVLCLLLLSLACTFGGTVATETAPPGPTEMGGGEASQPVTTVPQPTMTPVSALESGDCSLNAAFEADVTVPDDTPLTPGASFTKVWRLRNSGTCNWKVGTQLVFVEGEPMSAVGAVSVPAVSRGAMTDVGVDMVAPTAPGTYKSIWQLQAPDGRRFGHRVYVQIVVPAPPTPTPPPTVTPIPPSPTPTLLPFVTLPALITVMPTLPPPPTMVSLEPSARGQVDGAGNMSSGVSNVGDRATNVGLQAFVTFDLSIIPDNATITYVGIDFPTYDTLGSPFAVLGCLRLYEDAYGTLDAGDYRPPPVVGAIARFCSTADLTDSDEQSMPSSVNAVQAHLTSDDRYQIRLQFNEMESNGDGVADVFRSNPYLLVGYVMP